MRKAKNVTITISIEERVVRWASFQAAQENISISRFVGALLGERMHEEKEYETAMKRYLSVRPKAISKGQKYPRREDLYM